MYVGARVKNQSDTACQVAAETEMLKTTHRRKSQQICTAAAISAGLRCKEQSLRRYICVSLIIKNSAITTTNVCKETIVYISVFMIY